MSKAKQVGKGEIVGSVTETDFVQPQVKETVVSLPKLSVIFHQKKFALVQELQSQMETNSAWVKNMFPLKIAELIEEMQGQIVTEVRMGSVGPFEFATIRFPDDSVANLPTLRALEQTVQKNEWVGSIKNHLMRAKG